MKYFLLIFFPILLSATISKGSSKLEADDTETLQSLFDKGGVINLPANKSFNITKTLYLKNNDEIINGNLCIINYLGNGAAIDFKLVNNKIFPVRNVINNLNIIVHTDGAIGVRWQCSSSSLSNCAVALNGNNETAYEIVGDVNGTGSYYNIFENCFAQGTVHLGNNNQYGWKFTYNKSMPGRCANACTWIGGRVGQCDVGMYINGAGNVINHMAAEGCNIAFYFDNNDSKVGCVSNQVVSPYVEKCKTAFKFGTNALACMASTPFITGVPSVKEDSGVRNVYIP